MQSKDKKLLITIIASLLVVFIATLIYLAKSDKTVNNNLAEETKIPVQEKAQEEGLTKGTVENINIVKPEIKTDMTKEEYMQYLEKILSAKWTNVLKNNSTNVTTYEYILRITPDGKLKNYEKISVKKTLEAYDKVIERIIHNIFPLKPLPKELVNTNNIFYVKFLSNGKVSVTIKEYIVKKQLANKEEYIAYLEQLLTTRLKIEPKENVSNENSFDLMIDKNGNIKDIYPVKYSITSKPENTDLVVKIIKECAPFEVPTKDFDDGIAFLNLKFYDNQVYIKPYKKQIATIEQKDHQHEINNIRQKQGLQKLPVRDYVYVLDDNKIESNKR